MFKFKTLVFCILTSNLYICFINNIIFFYNSSPNTFLLKDINGLRGNYYI